MIARNLLTELVRCPSVIPPNSTNVKTPYGEAAMVKLLRGLLLGMDGEVVVDDVYPGRPNLLAHFKGRDSSRTILLDAHTDTVSHKNMIIDPFGAEVLNGRLYGRGACDTKGPMTALLLGLESALANEGLAFDVVFSATCDEENGGGGAKKLVESVSADFAVIAEPTELKLVTQHKGVLRAEIMVQGKSAHSSTPEQGCNAIYAGNRIVSALEVLSCKLQDSVSDPMLGSATLAVVNIQGGTAINVIPNSCTIQIDRRIMPNEDFDAVKAQIESVVCDSVAGIVKSPPKITWIQFYPPMKAAENSQYLTALDASLRKITGSALYDAVAYATNGGFYAQAGIPCVVFGPGSITNAHTNNESIDLSEVKTASKIIHNFLVS